MTTPNTDSKEELARRIQRRILSETRQKLAETERKLEIVKEQVERLSNEIITKQSVMDQKIKLAEQQIALVAEKDHMIDMLKHRVKNVSEEYNQRWSYAQIEQTPQRSRQATTLKDVYKLTGELDQEGKKI